MSAAPQDRPAQGMSLGRMFGVPVVVSWSWFLGSLFIAYLILPLFRARFPDLAGSLRLGIALSFAILFGLSVLAHELAHAIAAKGYGFPVYRITLHVLGGVSEIGGEQHRPGSDFVIALVGPLTSLALGGVAIAMGWALPEGSIVELVVFQLAWANLIVGAFNLLPGLPLDGGRLLRDVVWGITKKERTGTLVAAWVGRGFAVLLAVLGLLPLLRGQQPQSDQVLAGLWLLAIAVFMWFQAGRVLTEAKLRERLPALQARTLARRAIPVGAQTPVSEALRQLHDAGARALVVVDHEGQPRGLVSEAAVAALPEQRRPWVTVASVARQVDAEATIPVGLFGTALLQRLSDSTISEYLVVDAKGAVFGVLSRGDVERALGRMGVAS